MSDHNLLDDPLVSFDEQQSTKTKANETFENRLLDDIDPFGNHNGQESHHNGTNTKDNISSNQFSLPNDLFPVDSNNTETCIKYFLLFFSISKSILTVLFINI